MFAQFDISFFLLLGLAALCYITHNNTVTFAVLLLLLFKLTPLATYFPFLNQYGLTIGIVILTAAMMVPLADGSLKILIAPENYGCYKVVVPNYLIKLII